MDTRAGAGYAASWTTEGTSGEKTVTEAEWLACTAPQKMLEFLRASGKLTERKARLLSAACCRRIWTLLTDQRSRTAVEVIERVTDGELSKAVLENAYVDAIDAYETVYYHSPFGGDYCPAEAVKCAASPGYGGSVEGAVMYAAWAKKGEG